MTEQAVEALATVPIGKHFKVTPTGLLVSGAPTFDDCALVGEILRTFERAIQFAIGDWLNYVEDRFAEQASQLVDSETGWSPQTTRAYAWVAASVPPENRLIDQGLSFSHHQVVAALPERDQKRWLTQALGTDEAGPWPVSRLKAAVRAGADPIVTGWFVHVDCGSEAKRDALLKRLELEGYGCKASERR